MQNWCDVRPTAFSHLLPGLLLLGGVWFDVLSQRAGIGVAFLAALNLTRVRFLKHTGSSCCYSGEHLYHLWTFVCCILYFKCKLTVSTWVRWCLARSLELLKAFRQPGCWHMYGFSPVWLRRWILRFSRRENAFWQPSNWQQKGENVCIIWFLVYYRHLTWWPTSVASICFSQEVSVFYCSNQLTVFCDAPCWVHYPLPTDPPNHPKHCLLLIQVTH